MNKKAIGIIIIIVIICIIGLFLLLQSNNNASKKQKAEDNDVVESTDKESKEDEPERGKILVVYYSAQNHTKTDANKIADNLKADTFEIVPEQKYTEEDLDWTDENSRVTKEHENESLRNVKLVTTKVEDWESYDTVLIGYPIWWAVAAWPVDTFVKENNFDGKTVIPFCTSTSSDLGQSGELLKKEANGGNWLEGHRFSSNPSDSAITSFINRIK